MVNLVSADIFDGTIVVEWIVQGDSCFSNCSEVEIFFDTPSLSIYGDSLYNNDTETYPVFVWNATLAEAAHRNFRTELNLTTYNDFTYGYNQFGYSSLIYYPFDYYTTKVTLSARDTLTSEELGLWVSWSSGKVVDLKMKVWSPASNMATWDETDKIIDMNLIIQRNTLVIVYCLVITFTFWMVTLMICFIMITTVVFGFRQRNEIVVVPIGTVFAFTQLRSSMPGAPEGFGSILDFVGLLPCLILLSISAIAMVGIYLFADPDDPSRRAFTWSELKNAFLHYSKRVWTTSKQCVRRVRFCILTVRWIWRRTPHNIEIPLVNTESENLV
ncbi:hypothetical protein ARMSODRAFT_1019578 [Armillaria solidipes]|uniref:Uncharacterized protein n=1 Tax=Armillaria solidipes TaxID=1076256 RepID=A0A2H3BC40_9AGAR|nr:hypothetical protein ARMSODRAFT_1019578 [Armillaria solidipes]